MIAAGASGLLVPFSALDQAGQMTFWAADGITVFAVYRVHQGDRDCGAVLLFHDETGNTP